MPFENPTTQRPAQANLAQSQEFSLATLVEQSLTDPNRDGMQIMDEFVGSLVAEGGVITSEGHYVTPQKVLADMEHCTTAIIRGEDQEKELKYFTRSNGLRDAVRSLLGDKRTSQLMPSARGALHHSKGEGIALTSPVQVKSYLQTLARKSGQSDSEPWISNMAKMYERVDDKLPTDPESVFAIGSAFASAKTAGADMEMLRRTVEVMRKPIKEAEKVGSVAMAPSAEVRLVSSKEAVNSDMAERDQMLDRVLDPEGTLPKVKLRERDANRLVVKVDSEDNIRDLEPLPEVDTKTYDIYSPEGHRVGVVALGTPEDVYMGSRESFIRDIKVYKEHRDKDYGLATYLNVLKSLPRGRGLRTEGVLKPEDLAIWEYLATQGLARPSNKGGAPTSFETTEWVKN